ncbi:MAG: RsmD family RNA methyltransferase [Alphaproteobacteria bacterium]|nr:RsmD family RNA methyltransferase [Alphaproteobacteria bacterium]
MRIVGGRLSGRKIEPPLSLVTRPMMDRVREALFNILAHRDWGKDIGDLFEGDIHALDAFCGTGALAFEAISWGAARATLFDKDSLALKIARQNAATLGIGGQCSILSADSTQPPQASSPCKLVFLAPPYRKNLIPPSFAALDAAGWIAPHAVIVAEIAKKEPFEAMPGCEVVVSKNYGDTALYFLRR